MKKVVIFGKPASGKSHFAKKLATRKNLPLHQLDLLIYKPNGDLIDADIFQAAHAEILASEKWLIDGFGPISSFYQRLESADTLIYIDLPYWLCYWLGTKRFLLSLFAHPEGWPKGSSAFKGTVNTYKTLRICPKFWNSAFLDKLEIYSKAKNIYIIRSLRELNQLQNGL